MDDHAHTCITLQSGMNLEYPLDEAYLGFKSVDILIFTKQQKFVLVGKNSLQTDFSILIIRKTKSNETCRRLYQILTTIDGTFCEDDVLLEMGRYVKKPQDNQKIHTLGILGFVRFLQGYYLVYVEEKQKISKIGRHKINLIKKCGMLPLFDWVYNSTSDDEKKYVQLFKAYKLQNCYYSYSYDLTNPLSLNMSRNSVQLFRNDIDHEVKDKQEQTYYGRQPAIFQTCQIFLWNYNLLREMSNIVKRKWILPIIHGYCRQINFKVKGTLFNVIIISRRSRHHAGTRYIKRGIDSQGFVANFVETEQIVVNKSMSQDTKPVCSSFLKVRGSAPVYWMQEPNFLKAKPAIEMVKSDPLHYSTRKHFSDLITRYGRVLYCFNLMKVIEKSPRQTILCNQFANAVEFLNRNDLSEDHLIHYIHFDYKANQKLLDKKVFIDKMHCMIYHCIMKMGVFVCLNSSRLDHSQYVQFQNGVIRTNCVDCLDRTNSFNQLMGQTALAIQICKLLKEDINLDICQENESIFREYRLLYEQMGDLISIQYGSSLAHKQKVNESAGVRFQFLTSLTRHYNNNFTDNARQQQIDVFLGNCYPQQEKIWEVEPSITLFPCRDLKKYSRKGWDQEAYANFQKLNRLKMFGQLNQPQLLKKFFDVNNYFRWKVSTQQLQTLFTASIVSKICNNKQNPDILTFCVQPNLKLSKKVWRALNPKSQKMTKMEDKCRRPYHMINCQFGQLVTQRRKQSDQKPLSDDEGDMTIFNNKVVGPSRKSSDRDFANIDQSEYFRMPQKELDAEDIRMICMYDVQSTITEDMVWSDMMMMSAFQNMQPDSNVPNQTKLNASDWKNIQYHINNKNYISSSSLTVLNLMTLGKLKQSRSNKECESPKLRKRVTDVFVNQKKSKVRT